MTETRFLGLAQRVKRRVLDLRVRHGISAATRAEMKRERRAVGHQDVPIDVAISEALAWLGRAQDHSLSADGGVARHYCLITGWGESYPETTGYIIPTLIREARISGDVSLLDRAQQMLDWLVSIQMPCGAFQGGTIGESPVVPVTFNTGQTLMRTGRWRQRIWLGLSQSNGVRGGLARGHPGSRRLLAKTFHAVCRTWGESPTRRMSPGACSKPLA